MKISVIGIGEIGGTIAKKLSKAGHKVSIANSKGKESVKKFAEEIGAEPKDLETISKDADVLIISVPFDPYLNYQKIFLTRFPKIQQ